MEAAKIALGVEEELHLGNLYAKRDWGHAKDYVYAMWQMMQLEEPIDLVISTGETYSVKEFVEKVFEFHNINIVWKGEGVDEVGINKETGKVIIRIDSYFFRPSEVEFLLGDSSKAKNLLNWEPKIKFNDLVYLMAKSDLELIKKKYLNVEEVFIKNK